jgi:hypothetical protein
MKGRTLDGIIGIQFKGKIRGIEKAFGGLVQMQRSLGPDTLMIETIPTPEIPGNLFYVRFKGSIDDFMKVDGELKDLKSTLAIDTVPLPEHLFIGTWPTPETPSDANIWYITFG